MEMTVHEVASQLSYVLLAYEPRKMVKRVLEFDKIFNRYLKNNPDLADDSLLNQLGNWLKIAQPHLNEFEWLQYYLIIWLDKKGGGDIAVPAVLRVFAQTLSNYQQSELTINYQLMQTKSLIESLS